MVLSLLTLPLRVPHTKNGKGLACDTISVLGQIVLGGHSALGQNVLGGIWRGGRGGNLFTTAGPLTVSLGLSLAIYCGLWHDDGDARCSTRTHDPVSTSLGDGQPLASHNLSRVKHGWFPNLSGVGGG